MQILYRKKAVLESWKMNRSWKNHGISVLKTGGNPVRMYQNGQNSPPTGSVELKKGWFIQSVMDGDPDI